MQALDAAGIDYMITGSVASSLQGEPRSTHDLDVVAEISAEQVDIVTGAFPPPAFFLDEDAAREAVKTGGMFNVIDVQEGDKVDFWLLTDDAFDRSRFARKSTENVFGILIKVSAPEDTILQKLRWAQLAGGSEKYFVDALRVYEVQVGQLNLEYMQHWVEQLDLDKLWTRLQDEADDT
ncbi:MAG TPA: hypothetical protein VM100_13975 [Longimicrobiales bacterium]|nr:hypothetical protein [Longimicrobiales bacterium]